MRLGVKKRLLTLYVALSVTALMRHIHLIFFLNPRLKQKFKHAVKVFWTKLVPVLKSNVASLDDSLQFFRLGIHGWLGVNERDFHIWVSEMLSQIYVQTIPRFY